jgi:short-subunit dehydrogenase involved in D-alanine esterification of teichoic acids
VLHLIVSQQKKIVVIIWCCLSALNFCLSANCLLPLLHANFRMIQTNYIGPFILTSILLPLLKNSSVPSRVVNLTSFTHRCGKCWV